jgi:hypothetical protein
MKTKMKFNRSIALALSTLFLVSIGSAQNWGPSYQYDYGYNPKIANYVQTVVEVHNAGNGFGPLWYHVGYIDPSSPTITWGPNSYLYDYGWNPSVAYAGSSVVEVHNAGNGVGPMWYRVGHITGQYTISWGPGHQYDNGYNPRVTIEGSTVVEVHNGGNGVGPMWYHVGHITGSTISWGPSYQYDYGWNPSVAPCNINLVEVHNGGDNVGPMWSHDGGFFNGYYTINWGGAYSYDYGWNPSVAGWNSAVEVHNGQAGVGSLWYHVTNSPCFY